jgi:NADPH:quinone reductase-like Zn-dependent oxidoreductase
MTTHNENTFYFSHTASRRFAVKTKGALIWEFNQPWTIEEIEIGDPAKNEVKIQMEASGMCHSDHHLVTGGIPMMGFPVLGGHEGAGIVTEVGEGVESVAVGEWVLVPEDATEGKEAGSMEMTVRWDAGRTFLVRDARLTPPDGSGDACHPTATLFNPWLT